MTPSPILRNAAKVTVATALAAALLGTTDAFAATGGKFDFGPTGSTLAGGYTRDSGLAFSSARGFGWVRQDSLGTTSHVALDLSKNTRSRSGVTDPRLRTIIHMQFPAGKTGGTSTPGAWELVVPNGSYEVSVTAGDAAYFDSTNTVRAEKVVLIDNFVNTVNTKFKTATKVVNVTDGRLTIDAIGGKNTKIASVGVTPVATTTTTTATTTTTPTTTTPTTTTTTPVVSEPVVAPTAPVQQDTVAAPAAPAAVTVPEDFYGINTQHVFKDGDTAIDSRLAMAAAGGLQVVRHDMGWKYLEPTAPSGGVHDYHWSTFDKMVRQAAVRGLRWQPLLVQAPTWAAAYPSAVNSGPSAAHVADFTALVKAVVARYGANGSFWSLNPTVPKLPFESYEIWNEENANWWWGTLTNGPEDYAGMFVAAANAIKSADGSARVLVGGLAPTWNNATYPTEFVRRMMAARPEIARLADAIAYHPYATTSADVEKLIKTFRGTLDTYVSTSMPIALTETGWTTYNTTEAARATFLSDLVTRLPRSDCKISELQVHTLVTAETTATNKEDWYGLISPTGTIHSSGAAFFNAIKTMRGLTGTAPTGTVSICY